MKQYIKMLEVYDANGIAKKGVRHRIKNKEKGEINKRSEMQKID